MWEVETSLVDADTSRVTLKQGGTILSYEQVLELWSHSDGFTEFFTEQLLGSPFAGAFWETPPVTLGTLERPFEYVLVNAKMLENLKPEPNVFADRFGSGKFSEIATFPNLGGDAILVVPQPLCDVITYTHLLRFLRGAPTTQVRAFWRAAGDAMRKRISDRPTWLSTAGLGVSWLHLRLDSRPKYYRHAPYKSSPPS